jgi:hypothetical protein
VILYPFALVISITNPESDSLPLLAWNYISLWDYIGGRFIGTQSVLLVLHVQVA